ncbi:MAG TPA: alpha-L-rhamnosidase C-terminal domain-containing protein, partial [Candidatus Dormibacteraeota bacterium]|nr:alpha-L-rhamnosidase C-terminal domain-containing protein [Candidatus Dormibacteraeota bacterium]
DGIKPDGSFQDAGMNSFNHYAYGAIGEWMYRVVAGVEIDEAHPGYKHILIQPQPGGGLTFANASVESMYGRVASGWKITEGKLTVNVEVPPNTTATVRLPKAKLEQATEGQKPLTNRADLLGAHQAADAVLVEVGSGQYVFESGFAGTTPGP